MIRLIFLFYTTLITISGLTFLFVLNTPIDNSVPVISFPKAVDIESYPVLDDCKDSEFVTDTNNSSQNNELIKQSSALATFDLHEGYILGRVRHTIQGLPSGYECTDSFKLAIQNTKTNQILKNEGILQGLKVNAGSLQLAGWLAFGDFDTRSEIVERYNEARDLPNCSDSVTYNCNREPIQALPEFLDGEIKSENGRTTLHRYSESHWTNKVLFHHEIHIDNRMQVNLSTETIYNIETGIVI
jgi:hypothetical protein